MPRVAKPRLPFPTPPPSVLLLLLAIVGIFTFTKGFFLTRTELPHHSSCGEASTLLRAAPFSLSDADLSSLLDAGVLSGSLSPLAPSSSSSFPPSFGCWQPRLVDKVVIVIIDALRFDFALRHLPKTMTAYPPGDKQSPSSLLRFVADPPTVTTQRLKGLTTGGLPTFADVGSSFSAKSISEDNFLFQLASSPPSLRQHASSSSSSSSSYSTPSARMSFVGDDTWMDLFPSVFTSSHPYPSFNTRDLHTVDDGVLLHLPSMLSPDNVDELSVAHFLGVDHVGHTFGPNSPQMSLKLKQMDDAVLNILSTVDGSHSVEHGKCAAVLVFGDHGMTEGGNHGGGTADETGAALFTHFSPGCTFRPHPPLTGVEWGSDGPRSFAEVNQVDLVPTVSLLLGLPIPFANIGSIIPDLLPDIPSSPSFAVQAATSLALNAAQVYRYLNLYESSHSLPARSMSALRTSLTAASAKYRDALTSLPAGSADSLAFLEACAMFKSFLRDATALGRDVWTSFNVPAMICGGAMLLIAVCGTFPMTTASIDASIFASATRTQILAMLTATAAFSFIFFHSFLLFLSNSYIEAEQQFLTFSIAIICLCLTAIRVHQQKGSSSVSSTTSSSSSSQFSLPLPPQDPPQLRSSSTINDYLTHYLSLVFPMIIPILSRLHEEVVGGHGVDASLQLHLAQHWLAFLPSLFVLCWFRYRLSAASPSSRAIIPQLLLPFSLECIAIAFLAVSWIAKRQQPNINEVTSFFVLDSKSSLTFARIAIYLPALLLLFLPAQQRLVQAFRFLIILMTLTGPSSASSAVLLSLQFVAIIRLNEHIKTMSPMITAALLSLSLRHAFFATNHACAFSRLHYSSAFVAAESFSFYVSGICLFLNTFGWDLLYAYLASERRATEAPNADAVWDWYRWIATSEALGACLSVSIHRRHLMIYAIFAPRFVFAICFWAVTTLVFGIGTARQTLGAWLLSHRGATALHAGSKFHLTKAS